MKISLRPAYRCWIAAGAGFFAPNVSGVLSLERPASYLVIILIMILFYLAAGWLVSLLSILSTLFGLIIASGFEIVLFLSKPLRLVYRKWPILHKSTLLRRMFPRHSDDSTSEAALAYQLLVFFMLLWVVSNGAVFLVNGLSGDQSWAELWNGINWVLIIVVSIALHTILAGVILLLMIIEAIEKSFRSESSNGGKNTQ